MYTDHKLHQINEDNNTNVETKAMYVAMIF